MLVYIAFDPSETALAGRPARDLLLDRLRRHGVVALTRDEVRRLRDEFRAVAPGEWPRWQEILVSLPFHVPNRELKTRTVADLVPLGTSGTVYTASTIADSWLSDIGADLEAGSALIRTDPPVEAVRLDSLHRSTLLERCAARSTAALNAGTHRSVLWDDIAPLLEHASRIVVTDRFALDCASKGIHTAPKPNGMEWLISRIADLPQRQPISLTVFGYLPDPPWNTRRHFDDLADHLWAKSGTALDELVLAPGRPDQFGRLVHHRSLRIGGVGKLDRSVILDNSLSVLDDDYLTSPLHVTYRVLNSREATEERELEERLQKLADRTMGTFTRRR